jgi:hypothetical protein
MLFERKTPLLEEAHGAVEEMAVVGKQKTYSCISYLHI